MESLGASRAHIAAAIGPCIGRASYEVDDGFVQHFLADDPSNERFFAAGKPGHAMFDIAAYVAARLAAAGVTRIAIGRTEPLEPKSTRLKSRHSSQPLTPS